MKKKIILKKEMKEMKEMKEREKSKGKEVDKKKKKSTVLYEIKEFVNSDIFKVSIRMVKRLWFVNEAIKKGLGIDLIDILLQIFSN